MGRETREFGRHAGLLSAGVGASGVLTYLFFSLASHNLGPHEYGEIAVLWSAVFVTISVAHRPVEQLLSRTIAERLARGEEIGSALRIGAAIQLTGAGVLVAAGLAFRGPLEDGLLRGSSELYWVLVFAVAAFAVSYYTRGVLAGSRRFALLAGLLVCESGARAALALAVALGIAEGQTTIALGVAAAPALTMLLGPLALLAVGRAARARAGAAPSERPVSAAGGGGFAAAVLVVMLSEQALLNAGPLLVNAFVDAAAAGFIFNVLMVVRAPVLVFQGVAATLLPHLTRLRADGERGEGDFHASVNATLAAVAAFAAFALVVVLVAGPDLMRIAFGPDFEYDRLGLALMAVAMGFYLSSTTLSQAALARGVAGRAARCWAVAATLFLAWCLLPVVDDEARRVEIGFLAAAIVLAGLLARVHRGAPGTAMAPDSPDEIEARLAASEEAG